MTDLLTRLEQATEGSRELDVQIALEWLYLESTDEAHVRPTNRYDTEARPGDYWLVQRSGQQLKAAPHYTTSLDAKLPWEDIRSSRYLFVEKLWEARHFEPLGDQGSDGGFWIGKAKTEILARRIAALRARG